MFAGEEIHATQQNDADLAVVGNAERPTFKWDDEPTEFLLSAYHSRRHLFRDPKIRKKDLWWEILREMHAKGFQVADEEALDSKMRNMKKKYKILINKTNTENYANKHCNWRYFDKMHELFSIESSGEPPTDVLRPSCRPQEKRLIPKEYKWDEKGVEFLLDEYYKRRELFLNPEIRKKDLWYELLHEMREAGFQVESEEALNIKMRNLKKTYTRKKEEKLTGEYLWWPYFQKCDEIFSSDGLKWFESSDEPPPTTQMMRPPCRIRKRKVITEESKWKQDAVEFLLNAYHQRRDLFRIGQRRKRDLWFEILQEMTAAGFQVENIEALDSKMRNMKKRYKNIKNIISTEGRKANWLYFDKLEAIFSSDCPYDPMSSVGDSWETTFVEKSASCMVSSAHTSSCQESPTKIIDSSNNMPKTPLTIEERKAKVTADMRATLKESKNRLEEQNLLLQQLNISTTSTQTLDAINEVPCKKNDFTFEFINTTSESFDPDADIKNEPIEWEEIDDDTHESNCGQIRLNLTGNFVFVCGFCYERHDNMIDFGLHLKKRHGDHLKPFDCLDTTAKAKTFAETVDELPALSNDASEAVDDPSQLKTEIREQDLSANETEAKHTTTDRASRHSETLPIALDPWIRQCKYCNQEFETRDLCTEHESTHASENSYLCWYCPETFRTYHSRNDHVRVHTGERPFKCIECPKSFAERSKLHLHFRNHKKRFSCRICGKALCTEVALKYHERRHNSTGRTLSSGLRSVICEQCGKTFKNMYSLKQHQKRHAGILDHKCEECGKGFFSKYNLRAHMSLHTGEMPFECDVCSMKFAKRPALIVHLELHSEEKSHVCNLCGKAYVANSSLQAHLRSHRIHSSLVH